jgi:hypothetical protein
MEEEPPSRRETWYHVTTADRLSEIAEEGLVPSSRPAIGGDAYATHKQGGVFLTEASGVVFWLERSDAFIVDRFDDYDKEGIAPVVMRVTVDGRGLRTDEVGTKDAGSLACICGETIPPESLEIWCGEEWAPVGAKSPDLGDAFDDEGCLNYRSNLREPDMSPPRLEPPTPPELRSLTAYTGLNPSVSASARNWNEEAFCLSASRPGDVSPLGHTGRGVVYGYLRGTPNTEKIVAKNEYGLARDKAYRRWLLMSRMQLSDGSRGEWGEVGEYSHGNMGIMLAYRNEGAGRSFVKELMKRGEIEPSIGYSPEGLKTVVSAHREIVFEALAAGKPVSPAALESHGLSGVGEPATKARDLALAGASLRARKGIEVA